MENAKMGMNGIYRTSDLYIAAWLLSKGLELKDINRRNRQRCASSSSLQHNYTRALPFEFAVTSTAPNGLTTVGRENNNDS